MENDKWKFTYLAVESNKIENKPLKTGKRAVARTNAASREVARTKPESTLNLAQNLT